MLRLLPRTGVGAMLVVAIVAGLSCRGGDSERPADQAANGARKIDPNQPIQPLNRHSVQTPQLEALMKVIAMVAAENTPRTLPGDVQTRPATKAELDKSYEQAAVLADALVTAADRIPFTLEGKTVPPETLRGFLNEAQILKDTAKELKESAQQRKGEGMSRSLDRMNATCITCHSKYRDLAGAMDFPRADGWTPERPKVARQ